MQSDKIAAKESLQVKSLLPPRFLISTAFTMEAPSAKILKVRTAPSPIFVLIGICNCHRIKQGRIVRMRSHKLFSPARIVSFLSLDVRLNVLTTLNEANYRLNVRTVARIVFGNGRVPHC